MGKPLQGISPYPIHDEQNLFVILTAYFIILLHWQVSNSNYFEYCHVNFLLHPQTSLSLNKIHIYNSKYF
jgi:hypothetical protein